MNMPFFLVYYTPKQNLSWMILILARKLQRQGMEHDVSKEGHRTASHHGVAIHAGVGRLAVGFEDHLTDVN